MDMAMIIQSEQQRLQIENLQRSLENHCRALVKSENPTLIAGYRLKIAAVLIMLNEARKP